MSAQHKTGPRPLWHHALFALSLPVILLLLAIALPLFLLHRLLLYLLVWTLWLPRGKDILVVYSNIPIWHDYMSTQVLPLVEERAIVLNWSERSKWSNWGLPQQVLRSFGGRREFNPMVIRFRLFQRAQFFRFWSAFKDFKHGCTEPVERLRNDLRSTL